jgi:LAS superfamily LD-carboxypeptidase LdcB
VGFFEADGYVRRPYRQRRAAHMRALLVGCVTVFTALVVTVAVFLFYNQSTAQLQDPALWSLRLVDAQHPLDDDFSVVVSAVPEEYLPDDAKQDEPIFFDARAYDALCAMLADAGKEGLCPIVTRGYVSIQQQRDAFRAEQLRLRQEEGYRAAEAYAAASQSVGEPDTCEYCLGLVADLDTTLAYDDFESSALYTWLEKNAGRYGFILRQSPPGSVRYVGAEAARQMRRQKMTLEEYVAYLDAQMQQAASES